MYDESSVNKYIGWVGTLEHLVFTWTPVPTVDIMTRK